MGKMLKFRLRIFYDHKTYPEPDSASKKTQIQRRNRSLNGIEVVDPTPGFSL